MDLKVPYSQELATAGCTASFDSSDFISHILFLAQPRKGFASLPGSEPKLFCLLCVHVNHCTVEALEIYKNICGFNKLKANCIINCVVFLKAENLAFPHGENVILNLTLIYCLMAKIKLKIEL